MQNEITVTAGQLAETLNLLKVSKDSGNIMELLDNYLVEINVDELKLTTTDLARRSTLVTKLSDSKEISETFCISPLFADLMNLLPKDERLHLTVDRERQKLIVESEKKTHELPSKKYIFSILKGEVFPQFEPTRLINNQGDWNIDLDIDIFFNLLKSVVWAADKNNVRKSLECVLFEISQNDITAQASNGFLAAYKRISRSENAADPYNKTDLHSVLIGITDVTKIMTFFQNAKGTCRLEKVSGNLTIKGKDSQSGENFNLEYSCRIVGDKFPDILVIANQIQEEGTFTITNKNDLKDALKSITAFYKGKAKGNEPRDLISLTCTNNNLQITTTAKVDKTSEATDEAKIDIPIQYSGEPITFGILLSQLSKLINANEDAEIKFIYDAKNKPLKVIPKNPQTIYEFNIIQLARL